MTIQMKRSLVAVVVVFLVLLVLVSILIGCSTAKPMADVDLTRLKDGIYQGQSFKFPGKIVVSVTVTNKKVSAVKVLSQAAVQKYTDMLAPLIAEIIKKQSVLVDDVTGATISARALKRAVYDGMLKAAGEGSD